MAKPISLSYTFATQSGPIPLSYLDSNYSTITTAINDTLTYSNYLVDTGAANAYAVTFAGSLTTSYTAGLLIAFKAANANTGASTLNVNSLGVKNIVRPDGTALGSGEIPANGIALVCYDGTNFQLLSVKGNTPSADVVGPASATDNAVTRFDGTTGKLIQNSSVLITDAGAINGADGTSALPAFSFSADTNTGFYRSSADVMYAVTGGVQRLYMGASGIIANNVSGFGVGAGSGGSVVQTGSRTNGVTLDKISGRITLVSAAGTTTWQSFTLTNATITGTDTVIVNQRSGTDLYMIHVTNIVTGSCRITFATTGGTTTEAPSFNFQVIQGSIT